MKPNVAKFIVVAMAIIQCETIALAQTPAKPDSAASMVIAPGTSAASGPRASNPDNMPVKRPTTPPNANRMILNSPASDAIAK